MPAAPALTRDASQVMLSLAQVRVNVGVGALTEENITDERADEALCGLHVATADGALAAAQAAQTTANQGVSAAQAAKAQADKGVSDAAAALAEANRRMPTVAGAAEGDVPVFTAGGNLVSSGKPFFEFTRATMVLLEDGTLEITTLA